MVLAKKGSGKTLDVISPQENRVISHIIYNTAEDIKEVVKIAQKAQGFWGKLTFKKRPEILYNYRETF